MIRLPAALGAVTEPVLRPIRRILPPLRAGGHGHRSVDPVVILVAQIVVIPPARLTDATTRLGPPRGPGGSVAGLWIAASPPSSRSSRPSAPSSSVSAEGLQRRRGRRVPGEGGGRGRASHRAAPPDRRAAPSGQRADRAAGGRDGGGRARVPASAPAAGIAAVRPSPTTPSSRPCCSPSASSSRPSGRARQRRTGSCPRPRSGRARSSPAPRTRPRQLVTDSQQRLHDEVARLEGDAGPVGHRRREHGPAPRVRAHAAARDALGGPQVDRGERPAGGVAHGDAARGVDSGRPSRPGRSPPGTTAVRPPAPMPMRRPMRTTTRTVPSPRCST